MFDRTVLRQTLQDWFVGEPQVEGGLTLYPVFPGRNRPSTPPYVPLHDALQADTARITEKPAASVPVLLLENRAAAMILAIDGQDLVGGKQDRMLTTSVLIDAMQTVELPVACVEHGRWRHTSSQFSAGQGGHGSLRRASHHAVSRHLQGHGTHQTDQNGVWDHLAHGHQSHGTHSSTGAMRDLHAARSVDLEACVQRLPYPTGAVGAVAVLEDGSAVADIFDRAETAAGHWPRLVRSYAWDAVQPGRMVPRATPMRPQVLLEEAAAAELVPHGSPGCGTDVRIKGVRVSGAALCYGDAPIHVSLFVEPGSGLTARTLDFGRLVTEVPGFLSGAECDEFIERSEQAGYRIAPITTRDGPLEAPDVRNNDRVMFNDVPLALKLWERIRPHVPASFEGWNAVGLNERFRFYRYAAGQRFAPHYDGCYTRHSGERSMLSFIIYLNDGARGGQTRFYDERQELRFAVEPARGKALIFDHDQLHEGAPVRSGLKYVLRTDVMYRKPA